ncbi:hypothetical protein J6590_056330 [Homalodisca vitripennis]|nr:hypothetical protein J6590_056330 [Homalodisca vitripennis]
MTLGRACAGKSDAHKVVTEHVKSSGPSLYFIVTSRGNLNIHRVVDSESGPTPSPVAHGIPAARVETHLPDLGAVRGALGLLLRQGVAPGPRGPWGAPHTPGPHPAPGVA